MCCQQAEAAKKQLMHYEMTPPVRWGMAGGVAPVPHTHPRGCRAGRARGTRPWPGAQRRCRCRRAPLPARGTGNVSVAAGSDTGPGAQGRCRCRWRPREEEPGPAPGGAALLGPAALRKRRGGRAVRRPWVSEGGGEGVRGWGSPCRQGGLVHSPGAAQLSPAAGSWRAPASGGCVCRSWPPPQPRPSPPRKVLLLSAICLRFLS